jgi:hypothetical protein
MSIVRLRMEVLERIREREDVLKCVDAEEVDAEDALTEVVVEDALMEAELVVEDALMEAELVVEEVNGCLFDVTAMSNVTREAMIAVADEARSMLNVLHAPIGPLRMPKLLLLFPPLRLPHLYPQKRKPAVLVMSRRPLELFRRRHLVKLNPRFK